MTAVLAIGPLVTAMLGSSPALANGQSTHIWITREAVSHLPPGDLADLLADPALQQMLDNGAMFPDGGYPLGDGYSEIAHWEPFQNLYRDHIATDCQAPWTDICAQQIAFLMGMASHSMADQVYDSLYYERGLQRDPDSSFDDHSFDQATDVAFMAVVGAAAPDGDFTLMDSHRPLSGATMKPRFSLSSFAAGESL